MVQSGSSLVPRRASTVLVCRTRVGGGGGRERSPVWDTRAKGSTSLPQLRTFRKVRTDRVRRGRLTRIDSKDNTSDCDSFRWSGWCRNNSQCPAPRTHPSSRDGAMRDGTETPSTFPTLLSRTLGKFFLPRFREVRDGSRPNRTSRAHTTLGDKTGRTEVVGHLVPSTPSDACVPYRRADRHPSIPTPTWTLVSRDPESCLPRDPSGT